MSQLSMVDMNSLNAIAGYLRHTGAASDERASQVLLRIQKKATDLLKKQDAVVNMVFELLDAYDINLWQDISYVDIAEVWCDAVNENPDDDAIKAKLKELLFG